MRCCSGESSPAHLTQCRSIPRRSAFSATIGSDRTFLIIALGYQQSNDETISLTLERIQGFIILMVRTDATFHSGQLAKATSLSADTIRHYERIGVLPKAVRSSAGYRLYPGSAVERVHVVQRALRIGFTLTELSDIFKTRDAGGTPCQRVYELAQEKLAGITGDIAALKQIERYMKKVLADWESRIGRAGGQKANLLQSLTNALKDSPKRTLRRRP